MTARLLAIAALASLLAAGVVALAADGAASGESAGFVDVVLPVLQARCVKCHGKTGRVEGDVNLQSLLSVTDLTARPELAGALLEAIDSGLMPPEDEPQLNEATRRQLVSELRELLHQALKLRSDSVQTPIRRMNRFQYNNAVQDLFQLNVEVFPLPERMLREHGNYFRPETGKMPPQLQAGSRPLGKSQLIERCLGGVTAFPQDLRAENGFDTRSDHLTLSPLLLESFLRLSRSIVESPDFQRKNCGIWDEFFAEPRFVGAGKSADDSAADRAAVVRNRLHRFLTRAFRRPVGDETLDRYAGYVASQLASGESFMEAMKDAAAAVIASPRFFYLSDWTEAENVGTLDDFALASRLSFFLWGSLPDETLRELAAAGTLHEPDVLSGQVDRLLRDKRLKRFCDSFPSQWLQLERIISSTPDPERFPQFYFAKYRASMHMMLEPLLLFETVLIEDQSILQLVDSDFSYRSDLLDAWYRDGSQGSAGSPTEVLFRRVPVTDRRQGGVITSAAVLTMTSGTTRTKPITRGAWLAGVILNDPPPPPPADVPPLADKPAADEANLTLRERFIAHRQAPACAGCHQRIDPLGFALENFDAAGIWRDQYDNGRTVDASGTLFGRYEFRDVGEFKDALLKEPDRFARAFAGHLLSFATGRETGVEDVPAIDRIVRQTAGDNFRMQALIRHVVLSDSFRK